MMGFLRRTAAILICTALAAFCLSACTASEPEENVTIKAEPEVTDVPEEAEAEPETAEEAGEDTDDSEDYTEGLGDTFIGDTETSPAMDVKDVDLIFFMGQSNMSGAAGDASLAPHVSEEAGMEFRPISDPTKLYPITEPFGINENNPAGLTEYPGAKKGSLVSAFVNEYYKETGRRVVAVSVSMGATDMDKWMTAGVINDVGQRFDLATSFLKDNGYNVGHIYALWLHGESDAIKGTDPEVYRTDLDDIMRPLFIKGLQKVFIIAPGRTIDYKDIFLDIINMQKKICVESGYYAMATTVLTRVSTEYMTDMYHYNQHVLNMVGIESAKSVAYYTEHKEEKIVYDYREGKDLVPDGVDPDSQEKEDHIHLSDININEVY